MSVETVLITGASSGIGLELAKCFAGDGSQLVLVARSQDKLEALASDLRKTYHVQAHVYRADLAQHDAPGQLAAALKAGGLQIDVLVNNAGFGAQGHFAELPLQRQIEMVEVNVTALTHLTGLFLPEMIARHRGGILNVASTAGFQPGPGMAVYYATKAYVLSFTEALAEEVAGTGVTVTAFCPGATTTNFAEAAGAHFSSSFKKGAMAVEPVARFGHRAFRQGREVAIPGLHNRLLAFSVRLVPRSLVRKIAKQLNLASYSASSAQTK